MTSRLRSPKRSATSPRETAEERRGVVRTRSALRDRTAKTRSREDGLGRRKASRAGMPEHGVRGDIHVSGGIVGEDRTRGCRRFSQYLQRRRSGVEAVAEPISIARIALAELPLPLDVADRWRKAQHVHVLRSIASSAESARLAFAPRRTIRVTRRAFSRGNGLTTLCGPSRSLCSPWRALCDP